jgi:hypothetical protein
MPSPLVTIILVIWCFWFSIAPSTSRSLPPTTDCADWPEAWAIALVSSSIWNQL